MAIDRGVVWRHVARHVGRSLLLNGVAPYVIYAICSPHMAVMNALLLAALVPLADVAVILARHRRLDAFGACIVLSLALSGVAVMLGGNPRWVSPASPCYRALLGPSCCSRCLARNRSSTILPGISWLDTRRGA